MYKSDDGFEAPTHNAKVWRYSDITKFIRVLQTRALYFVGAELLTDLFEGTLTRPSQSEWVRILKERGLSAQQAYHSRDLAAGMVGVNCWHLGEYESAAMWQVYSPRDSPGIAIQSTFDRLSESFHSYKKHVWIGRTKYIDYTTDAIANVEDVKQWFLHKRREFSYEQELRAMIMTSWQPGMDVACDLPVLIESIRIAPTAPPYMIELVSEICRRFELQTEVFPSMLSERPSAIRRR
jgi:hypothetical protein